MLRLKAYEEKKAERALREAQEEKELLEMKDLLDGVDGEELGVIKGGAAGLKKTYSTALVDSYGNSKEAAPALGFVPMLDHSE